MKRMPVALTPEMKALAEQSEGIAKQFLPSDQELIIHPDEVGDPIGDAHHSPVKGVVHRYPDRCLLLPINVCPVYCRFCFRRESVGPGNRALTPDELNKAYDYIASEPNLWEVILTGGDPLILKPKILGDIINNLSAICHVKIIRCHTRVPMVDPTRINSAMLAALTNHRPVYIAIHANHPDEFTSQACDALAKLADSGITLLSQSVLLKNINDNLDTLSNLMRKFIENRIKPYYLHQADMARGTGHFRVDIKKGKKLMEALKANLSGLCIPRYMLDNAEGTGKIIIK